MLTLTDVGRELTGSCASEHQDENLHFLESCWHQSKVVKSLGKERDYLVVRKSNLLTRGTNVRKSHRAPML